MRKKLVLLLGCYWSVIAMAHSEPLSIAGLVVPFSASTAPYVLVSARAGEKVAALSDPRQLLTPNEWVMLQTETTATTAQGLPVLEVVDVLREAWEQPINWDHFFKGFGTWSGFGATIRAENYAGIPYEDRRAYQDDNGLLGSLTFGGGAGPSHPPVVLATIRAGSQMRVIWNVQAGVNYDVLGSRQVTGGYAVVGSYTALQTGTASLTVPADGSQKFFKVVY